MTPDTAVRGDTTPAPTIDAHHQLHTAVPIIAGLLRSWIDPLRRLAGQLDGDEVRQADRLAGCIADCAAVADEVADTSREAETTATEDAV